MENIYTTNKDNFEFKLLCKKSLGNKNDLYGRFFERGKKYNAKLEIINICKDTNYKPCTLMWVNFNSGFGNRFAVVGNIYLNNKAHWGNFKDFFHCPLELNRLNKIKTLRKVLNIK